MKAIQRTDSGFEKTRTVIKFVYYFLALPCLICYGAISLFILKGEAQGHNLGSFSDDFHLFSLMVWAGILIPLGVRQYGKILRRKMLNRIVSMLTSFERFSPQKQHQVFDAGRGKYLGIDIQRGTILYIHMVKKGVVDVVGLTNSDWANRELEGSALRLYTRMPDVPVLSIYAHPTVATPLFDTLGAMSHNSYSEPFPQEPWPEYVGRQSRFVEFEHDVVVPQVV